MRRRAAILLLVAACSDPPPAPVAFESYAVAAAGAYCGWAVRCGHAPDDATCRRLLDPKSYDTRGAADAIAAGRLRYDPAASARCLAAGRAAICSGPAFADPSCRDVFTGLVETGGACTSASDCAGDAPCQGLVCEPGCCRGTCGPKPAPALPFVLAEIGEVCARHEECVYDAYCMNGRCVGMPTRVGQHCEWGCATGDLYCDVVSETCRRHPLIGDTCDDDHRCNAGYAYCDGVCKPLPGPTEACTPTRRCIPSATCDADAGACAARGGEGAPCARDAECERVCDTAAGRCLGYATCSP